MQAIVQAGRDERGEEIVRLFHGGLFRNPAEAARDAKDVGVDRKRRKCGLQLYGIWWICSERWKWEKSWI